MTDMTDTPPARTHGGLPRQELAALGIPPEQVLDFSVNVNPYGPSPSMRAALQAAPLHTYPDPHALAARRALAQAAGVHANEVSLASGAAALLWDLARLWVRPGTSVLICEPTFCEFALAARACRGHVLSWRAYEAPHAPFAVSLQDLGQAARVARAEVLYLCAPNTPTGVCANAADLAEFAAHHQDLRIVLDQSFLSLSTHHAEHAVRMPPNVVRVRSLTKDHSLCGVRVGYALGHATTVRALQQARPAWDTSAQTQAAACQAPHEQEFVASSRHALLDGTAHLQAQCSALGLRALPSTTPFFLCQVQQQDAQRLRHQLLSQHHILVRDCASFGLPGYIRIGTRKPEANARLVQALERCL